METSTFGSGVEITEHSHQVVPTRGAVVKTKFEAESGRRIQFDVRSNNGQKLPFGAQAVGSDGKIWGTLDNASRLLVFGVKDKDSFEMRWSNGGCRVDYAVPVVNRELMYEKYDAVCVEGNRG